MIRLSFKLLYIKVIRTPQGLAKCFNRKLGAPGVKEGIKLVKCEPPIKALAALKAQSTHLK